jgi:hypothetical protein
VSADTTARSEFEVPPPDSELQRLEPLLGTWRSEEPTRDGVLWPPSAREQHPEFYWLDGGYFLVSTYQTAFGSDPAQKG